MTLKTPVRERIVQSARRLVTERGFAATSVDAVLEVADASKGAFFHHFPTKADLGRAIVEDYVADDSALLERLIAEAEAVSEDPGDVLLHVTRAIEGLGDAPLEEQPSCLMVTFIYENQLDVAGIGEPVKRSIEHWRERISGLLLRSAQTRPSLRKEDIPAIADHFFVTIEGAFLLARATEDASVLGRQVAQLRRYLELLLA